MNAVLKTKSCKDLEDFGDSADVAGPHEVIVEEDPEDGEFCAKGPISHIAGQEVEAKQLALGEFEGCEESVKEDFIAMGLKQICARSRVKEMEVTHLVTAQKAAADKAKRALAKVQKCKLKTATFPAWRKRSAQRKV